MLSAAKLPWVRMSDGDTATELCQYPISYCNSLSPFIFIITLIESKYVLDKTSDRTAVVMCVLHKNPVKACWDLKVMGTLDSGNSPSCYCPLKENLPALLATIS